MIIAVIVMTSQGDYALPSIAKPESDQFVNPGSLKLGNIRTNLDILSGHRGILCSRNEGIRAVIQVRLIRGYLTSLQTSNVGISPPSLGMTSGISVPVPVWETFGPIPEVNRKVYKPSNLSSFTHSVRSKPGRIALTRTFGP